ncbi:MAG: phage major capsid protein [Candidatus Nanopelagicaceae bacterium]
MDKKLEEIKVELDSKISELEKAKSIGILGQSKSNSDEVRLMNAFGANSIDKLMSTNVAETRFKHVNDNSKAAVLALKQDLDIARAIGQMFHGGELDRDGTPGRVKNIFESNFAREVDLKGRFKAFGSGVVGAGDELVPTLISANFIEEYELVKKVQGLFKSLNMPSATWEVPVQTKVTTARLIGEGAAATDTNFGTDKLVMSAKKFSEYFLLPEELDADSAAPVLALARAEVIEAQARAIERAILEGDISGTHMDSDVVAADDARKAWKGLRKAALAAASTVDFAGGGVTKVGLDAMRKKMGKYGVNPNELVYLAGSSAYSQMLNIDEVTSIDKVGSMATLVKGALSMYRGSPVVVSEFIREDLSDAGVHDGVTTNRTYLLLVNAKRFYMGQRAPIKVQIKPDARAEYDRWQLVSYQRCSFVGHKQAGEALAGGGTSAERSAVIGIDILS